MLSFSPWCNITLAFDFDSRISSSVDSENNIYVKTSADNCPAHSSAVSEDGNSYTY